MNEGVATPHTDKAAEAGGFKTTDTYRFARTFIANSRAGALATISEEGTPHVAIVYCVVHEDLSIYFSTRVEGRKYRNLLATPAVAMAFYNAPHLQTIQLTGTAARIDSLRLEQDILLELMKLRYQDPSWPAPPLQLFERGATNELAVIKVLPLEMTYANFEMPKAGHYQPFFKTIL